MGDRIDEKRISNADEALIRQTEADQIDRLAGQSHLAATTRVKNTVRAEEAARTRGDLTRVAESTRPDVPRTGDGKKQELPADKSPKFEIANERGLENLMSGRSKPVAGPEATVRKTDAGIQQPVRQPRPAAENARPSGATRVVSERAVQQRRDAPLTERLRGEAPREQVHLRAGTPRPLSFLQKLRIAVQIRAYVANLFKPKSPSSPEGAHAKQLQTSVSQKKPPSSDPKNQLAPKSAPGQPAGTKGAAKEAGTPETAGHLFAFDGTTGDAETQARVADNRDAFYRLVEPKASPLSFNADAWNQVRRERSDPPHLRNTSTETTHDHRRVEARRGRGDRLTG